MNGDQVYLPMVPRGGRYEAISKLETEPYLALPKGSDHIGFERDVTRILLSYSLYTMRYYVPELGIWTFPFVFFGAERMDMGDALRLYPGCESDELTVLDIQYICRSDSEPEVIFFRGNTYKLGADSARVRPESLPAPLRNTGDAWSLCRKDVKITHENIAGRFYPKRPLPQYGKHTQGVTECQTRCEVLKSTIPDVAGEIEERLLEASALIIPRDGFFYSKLI